jgi:DNA polymerase-1
MNKALRQNAKEFTLGIPYGVKSWQLSKILNNTQDEAQIIIDRYLNSYPGLKSYMQNCEESVKKTGKIASEMGRVRHVPEAKKLYMQHGDRLFWYNYRMELADSMGKSEAWKLFKKYKNYLNNAKNFPIQSTAASIVNRAAIKINRRLREENLDAWVCMQVHDEICLRSKEEHSKRVSEIVQDTMENIVELSVPLKAEPTIGYTYAEAK